MDIAALNVKITFQKNTIAADHYGNHKVSWDTYFICHATMGTGSGSENFAAAVVNPEESMDFTTRYCRELAAVEPTKYRILLGDKVYNINYVNPMGSKHNSLKFNCKLEKE